MVATNLILTHDCLTATQLATRWGKSRWTIHAYAKDPDHPLKAAAFSKRPLYFPLRVIENIEQGYAKSLLP